MVESVNENNDVLPSLNVVYQLAQRTNLRFGYGRSVNRPEFRELSPFTFTEVAGGRSVSGNPDLEQATIDGYDLRWETFPGAGDVIAASAFYKKIDKPIERIVQPTTDLRQSFVNAEAATLWGLELEFRRSLESLLPALRLWSVNLNYAYIQSDVTIGEQQLSVVTNTERPLEGQSDQIANLALQFYHPQWGTMVRFLGSLQRRAAHRSRRVRSARHLRSRRPPRSTSSSRRASARFAQGPGAEAGRHESPRRRNASSPRAAASSAASIRAASSA